MKYPDITLGRIEAVWNKLGGEEGVARFLADAVEIVLKKLFTKLPAVLVAALMQKPTRDCFTGAVWKYRDSNFDMWLSESQPKRSEQLVTVIKPERSWTFIEFAQAVLGVTTSDVKELGILLIAGGHTLTLTQAEDLVKRTEAGEATGLKTDGYGNFFFVETGNEDVPVAVGYVSRGDSVGWDADVDHLVRGIRWAVDRRFLLCNADTSKL